MDAMEMSMEMASIASLVFVLVLNAQHMLTEDDSTSDDEDAGYVNVVLMVGDNSALLDAKGVSRATLHHWRLWHSFTMLDKDLGFWVKPRSTAWFSTFLLQEYNDSRWIHIFRMTKKSVFSLSSLLAPCIQKSDTRFRQAIPVLIKVSCALFKLCHGSSLLLCSELFVVGRSSVSILLREVVEAMNISLRNQVSWPKAEELPCIAAGFEKLCGLPAVLGALDGTHFAIAKPRNGSTNYFYFKSGGFSMNCQAVVDSSKRFLDLYVGMLGATHDTRMLRRSALFHRGQHGQLWPDTPVIHGFSLYLIANAGYPILSWLMVPYRRQRLMSIPETLFNRRLSRGRVLAENAFALLKQGFRELNQKSDLDVRFFPNVVEACVLLHNVLRQSSHEDVEELLSALLHQGRDERVQNRESVPDVAEDRCVDVSEGVRKRLDLGLFLTSQRMASF